jgi:ribosomal protein S18 acetylase RimI-like enzyme
MRIATISFREIVRPDDPVLPAVRSLYEQSISPSERIPWDWLANTVSGLPWHSRRSHLIVARRDSASSSRGVLGFVAGCYLPQYGGYLSYVAVNPKARGRGIGASLYRALIRRLRRTASAWERDLPCLVWDSRPPSPSDGLEARANWESRLHLFKKIGGYWIEGIQFTSPNYLAPGSGDVPLEFFLKPVDTTATDFNEGRLRRIVRGLLKRVYRLDIDGEDGEMLKEYAPLKLKPIA